MRTGKNPEVSESRSRGSLVVMWVWDSGVWYVGVQCQGQGYPGVVREVLSHTCLSPRSHHAVLQLH